MAEDREVLREIWDGQIPVCFRLASEEVYTLQHPEPFYLMVPRITYFPLVTDKVQKHFSHHVRDDTLGTEMWIDYDSQPLKSHYPVGLLYDFYGSDAQLPWNVTIHFKDFPEDELVHCPNKSAVQSLFMSTVKEASALKHRSQLVQSMLPKEHKELWQGFEKDKFDQFWAINKRFMENAGDQHFKHIPFRLYRQGDSLIQTLVKPTRESGEAVTLRELLNSVLPQDIADGIGSKYRIVTHGIEPPLDIHIQWMSEHLSYADNFLHVVLLNRD